tara:strand:- start:398 stop:775 length:378 start_codon:yes stop_codon:yes gene_type:complete
MNTLLISTVLLNLLFIASAYGKINNFNATSKGLRGVFWIKGLPMWFFKLAIACVIVLLLVAPSIMVYSVFDTSKSEYAVYSCYALIAFTIMATLLYHFPTDPSQRISFMKNLSIIGGFLALSKLF